MSKRRLYILALCARKLLPASVAFDPVLRQTLTNQHTALGLSTWATIATSAEQARRAGVARAKEDWPEGEGWAEHSAAVCEVEYAALEDILRELAGETPTPDDAFIDVLM